MDAPDPAHFGYQSDRSYLPSPEEIAHECEAIRRGWSARESYHRSVGVPDRKHRLTPTQSMPAWVPPMIPVTAEVAAELE